MVRGHVLVLTLIVFTQTVCVWGFAVVAGLRPKRAVSSARLQVMDMVSFIEDAMSPQGGASIPDFLKVLDLARYVDQPALLDQPIIVRLGLGLLVIDVIPLALDLLFFRFLIKSAMGNGPETVELDSNVLSRADAVRFFNDKANKRAVSVRANSLLSAFYKELFDNGPEARTVEPEVRLFQLVSRLALGFEAVVDQLLVQGFIRNPEVVAILRDGAADDRAPSLLKLVKSGPASRFVRDPAKLKLVSSSLLGAIFVTPSEQGGRAVVIGVKSERGAGADLSQVALDLFILRGLLQTVTTLQGNSSTARRLLTLVDEQLEATLQLRRVFDPVAGQLLPSPSPSPSSSSSLSSEPRVAAISFESIYTA